LFGGQAVLALVGFLALKRAQAHPDRLVQRIARGQHRHGIDQMQQRFGGDAFHDHIMCIKRVAHRLVDHLAPAQQMERTHSVICIHVDQGDCTAVGLKGRRTHG
jgi:hypothetical protein